jgi:hypothetical protein
MPEYQLIAHEIVTLENIKIYTRNWGFMSFINYIQTQYLEKAEK